MFGNRVNSLSARRSTRRLARRLVRNSARRPQRQSAREIVFVKKLRVGMRIGRWSLRVSARRFGASAMLARRSQEPEELGGGENVLFFESRKLSAHNAVIFYISLWLNEEPCDIFKIQISTSKIRTPK